MHELEGEGEAEMHEHELHEHEMHEARGRGRIQTGARNRFGFQGLSDAMMEHMGHMAMEAETEAEAAEGFLPPFRWLPASWSRCRPERCRA